MTMIRLKYRRGLGYPGAGALPKIPMNDVAKFRDDHVITFRKPVKGDADQVISKVSAVYRVDVPSYKTAIVLYGIESDSPLAPLIIWDVMHRAAVGSVVIFVDSVVGNRYVDREYFKGKLRRVETSYGPAYQKLEPLDAEAGELDSWTFGIPTGPEDATLLNACVARILELPIPNKEILLCGRPGANFKYWDHVRIVGEDITAPPVQICKKKNRLVEEAKYENLCIIHDRVFLPANFCEMVEKFGNAFPFTAVQSLYFDDRHNLTPRRYSDFGVGLRLAAHVTEGLARSPRVETSRYSVSVMTALERTGFVCGNGHRWSPNNYATGSLYLVKKRVWQKVPQDERLMWTEFEDVEQGERAASLGIPSRINPYGLTQSMISRPIISWMGASTCEKVSGGDCLHRSWFERLTRLPRKPMLKKTEAQAIADMNRFLANWGVDADSTMEPTTSAVITSRRRTRWIIQAVSAVRLPLRRSVVERFLKDFTKLVVGEQIPYEWHQRSLDEFAKGGDVGRQWMMDACAELTNHAAQRPRKWVFAKEMTDFFPSSRWTVFLGSLTSAINLMWVNGGQFVLPGGFAWKVRTILDTTPFKRYAEETVSAWSPGEAQQGRQELAEVVR